MGLYGVILIVVAIICLAALLELLLLLYVLKVYGEDIYRVFETKPLLLAPKLPPEPGGEDVTVDAGGRKLAATYFKTRANKRRGVLLFCHEFGADRWLFQPYIGGLRDDGFDVCTFDFCNHGDSDSIDGYQPSQWVTTYEVDDVRAVIDYLKTRDDAPANGVGLFGVSKGGGAGIAAAAERPFVRALATDGAFPTHSMVTAYEQRWCVIFVRIKIAFQMLPRFFWTVLTWGVLLELQRKHNVKYPHLEAKIRRLKGRPIFMINGERDNYVKPEIAEDFFQCAKRPKELWIVPRAKHNGCLDVDPQSYRNRLKGFFTTHFPSIDGDASQSDEDAETEPECAGAQENELSGSAISP